MKIPYDCTCIFINDCLHMKSNKNTYQNIFALT